eukprot:10534160-Lingulodinium_polyedra.AAC.1
MGHNRPYSGRSVAAWAVLRCWLAATRATLGRCLTWRSLGAAWVLLGCCLGAGWVLLGCCLGTAWVLLGRRLW